MDFKLRYFNFTQVASVKLAYNISLYIMRYSMPITTYFLLKWQKLIHIIPEMEIRWGLIFRTDISSKIWNFLKSWDLSRLRAGAVPDSILSNCTEGSATEFLRLDVMRSQPQLLQLQVIFGWEIVTFQNFIKLSKITTTECNNLKRTVKS